ncbi:MAG: symmetrical bis(5'-nucleosyl)-tetraphosphatase [Gammaproteobacteria bacterium]
MAVYAIGDVQGCAVALEELLDDLQFDPAVDRLWLTGDLVNRGPHSLETLRLVKSFGDSVVTILGNHDLHLLAVAEGIKPLRHGDTLKKILSAPDRDELMHWLRHLPMLHVDHELKTLMVHAGVYPGWSIKKLKQRAGEVETVLRGDDYREFFENMYGRQPCAWSGKLDGMDRIRFITNSMTRMRYVSGKRQLDFNQKGPPGSQPGDLVPWYDHPQMKCHSWRIVCGHWSALGYMRRGQILSLDSGCVWGGALTAVRLDAKNNRQCWQVGCSA